MKLSILLLLVSLLLTGLGGAMDMMDVKRIGPISRRHVWTDGLYVAVLAIAVHLILRM